MFAGTSGFSYPEWRRSFYPADLPAREMLPFYARHLGTVEINQTFRRLPTPAALRTWTRQTPVSFRFALKAPQRITHQLRLKNAEESLGVFVRAARGLRKKLGPLLFQLPPYLRCDVTRLTAFLAAMPLDVEAAFEFRHESWFVEEIYETLRSPRAALCVADAETLSTPWIATAPFGYLRLRRSDYDERSVRAWGQRIRSERRWKRAYVYFKHEEGGRGPALARTLIAALGAS